MFYSGDSYFSTTAMVCSVALLCLFIQRFFKKYLESDQYYYLKDITLVGAWALCGVWAPDGPLRITIAAGIAAACVGFCQKVTKGKNLRFLYFFVGLGFSIFGPRITFIEFSGGEYYYLSHFASLTLSALWVGFFPILFQEIDEIPGLCGILLMISWALISVVILTSSQNLRDASQICIAGLVFLLVFWGRHMHSYRRLTEPLTALWGTLFAALSVFGVSKGIAFYTLGVLPLGLFALPLAETSLSVISAAFSPRPTGNLIFYRKLIRKGMNHVGAVRSVAFVCALIGCLAAWSQVSRANVLTVAGATLVVFVAIVLCFTLAFGVSREHDRKPGLWGIRVDNISLNYAITQVQYWINSNSEPRMIVTPDALAALRSRTDERYRRIVRNAGLILPDGKGLMMALRMIGCPVQERIPGVEFVEHICKRAAYSGWGVFLLGGEEGVAAKAAGALQDRYPGLVISGTRNGYFEDGQNMEICAGIKASGAKILLVGLGVPKQEYWLEDNLALSGATVGLGIGGSMDVLSGRLKRAPKIWQKMGMEWLYRFLQEPKRWRRVAKLPLFVFFVLLTVFHIDTYKDFDNGGDGAEA